MSDLVRVPKERYLAADYMRLEQERMWSRVWLLACHASRIPAPGDFATLDVGPESLLVARQADGSARAFHNVCQHRGNQLCQKDEGRAKSFRCPYHHWEYGLDGALLRAPRAASFPGGAPASELGLAEVRCGVALGFVWVSMSEAGEPLDEYLATVRPFLEPYRCETFALEQETTVAIDCNWKLSVDVSNEGYHVRALHPELLAVLDDTAVRLDLLGRHSRYLIPLGVAAPGTPSHGQVSETLRRYLDHVGVPAPFRGGAADVRPAIARATRARLDALGLALPGLDEEAMVDKQQVYVFPNVQLNLTAAGLELYRHRPHPTDPGRMFFDEQAYARAAPGAAARAEPTRRRIRHGEASLGPVMGADVDLLPGLQRGMASRGFRGLYLGADEACIENMHRALDAYLEGDGCTR